jgi:hypothetical protein
MGSRAPSTAIFRDLAAPLINRKVGDRNVTANKAMGQLKFAGKQSDKSLAAGSAARAAALTEDAFGQAESGAQGGKGLGCARSRRTVTGDKGEVKGGACQGDDEAGWTPGNAAGCPEDMTPAPGGGCRPVGELQGKNVTTYQKDVDRAKALADEAHSLSSGMMGGWGERREKAHKLAREGAEIGRKIKKESGQDDQGELIEGLAGGAWFHNDGNREHVKKEGEKRAKAIQADMDDRAAKAAEKESQAGYR